MIHEPDYAKHIATPVRGGDGFRARDQVIFACRCGEETCTWQVESTDQRNFRD